MEVLRSHKLALVATALVMVITVLIYLVWTHLLVNDVLGNHASMTGTWHPAKMPLREVPKDTRDPYRLLSLRSLTIEAGKEHSQEVSVHFDWKDGSQWTATARTDLMDDYLSITPADPQRGNIQLTIMGQQSHLMIDDGLIAYQLERAQP